MGYSEVHCRLCGVVFNIGRVRRFDEPLEGYGWMNTGDFKGNFFDADHSRDCTSENGCRYIRREGNTDQLPSNDRWRALAVDDDDDEKDPDYVYESSDGEEDYEYESEDNLIDDAEDTEDVEMTDATSDLEWAYFLTSNSGITQEPEVTGRKESHLKDIINPDVDLSLAESRVYEHVAGPTCQCIRGYNGYIITAEEMRGCNTFQCLVLKDRNWEPEVHDQEFEAQSTHFLSGLGDHMPSLDSGDDPDVIPARHGVAKVRATDYVWGHGDECMPFHTACLDIFMRMSRLRTGKVDINGLCAWYYIHDEYCPQSNKDMEACRDQWWNHVEGTEYLAANPVLVPRLSPILRSVISNHSNFDTRAGAFTALASPSTENSSDSFATLPFELRLEVVRYLHPKDVANLRLSSRTFHQLPIYLWREFIQRDMPWLWEIWSDEKPYLWSTVSVDALKKEEKEREDWFAEFENYWIVIKEEMPELLSLFLSADANFLAARPDPVVACETAALNDLVWTVSAERVNWYELYLKITRNWNSLKGLQNRRRIWNDMPDIFEQICKYREEGRITI